MWKSISIICNGVLLSQVLACTNPLEKDEVKSRTLKPEVEKLKTDLTAEKYEVMKGLVSKSNASLESIKPLLESKCFRCHDANTRLPIYNRILSKYNSGSRLQSDGLDALDFSEGYPFKAKETVTQLSLLYSMKNAILDRRMPPRQYSDLYKSNHLSDQEREKILEWVGPLITDLEAYLVKYETVKP